jgi:hypothetical protein
MEHLDTLKINKRINFGRLIDYEVIGTHTNEKS